MARTTSNVLTSTHRRILQSIGRLMTEGLPAHISNLVAELGYAGETSLMPTLKIMQRNGYVELHGGGEHAKRRVVTLTLRGKAAIGAGGLHVLGSIPAGPLTEYLDADVSFIDERSLLPYQPGDFLLVVEGDSMIGDGILPGDMVLLRPNMQFQNGEIVAVQVGDDRLATLKRVYANGDSVILRASNPAYQDIILDARLIKIIGAYRGLVRNS